MRISARSPGATHSFPASPVSPLAPKPAPSPCQPARAMNTVLSCQDLHFAGGQRYACPYSASASPDSSVDVSTATPLPPWDGGALDNAACQHETQRRDSQYAPEHGAAYEHSWSNRLSPQLQRNKQLQDTLMQREEELARLQEENNKLKEFLNSSYVKSLEEKTKKLLSLQRANGTRQRKRNMQGGDGDFRSLGQLLQGPEGKRTCRNLSLEFCSAEELAATPPLDSWILETLGLQDGDLIHPESSLDYSTEYNCASDSSGGFSQSMDASSSFSSLLCPRSDYATLDPSALYTVASTVTSTGSLVSPVSTLGSSEHFTPPRAASTPRRPGEPHPVQPFPSPSCDTYASPPGPGNTAFSTPPMLRTRTDLAFSMSLSPQSSVRTHSFPQGQAFVRKDAQGGWNFTWVPKQCP